MDNDLKKLSIIIPVYNEGKTLEALLRKVIEVQLVHDIRKELIIVNDCSKDNSEEITLKFIADHPDIEIRYDKHNVNSGKGMAIRTALKQVTGDYVVIQDADLEYDPEDYNVLLEYLITNNEKVVYGSRFLNKNNDHYSKVFLWGGRLVSFVTNILYGQSLTDEPTCYKMFDAQLIQSIPLNCTRFEFCTEVTAKVSKKGYKIREIPINYYPRKMEEGKKLKWYDGLEAVWSLLRYRFTD